MNLLNRLFVKKQQEQVVEQKHQVEQKQPLSNFQKSLKQLNAPYKKTKAYAIFKNQDRTDFLSEEATENTSVFWNPNAGYTKEYKNVDMKK